jgi:hypothetical protein
MALNLSDMALHFKPVITSSEVNSHRQLDAKK